MLRDDARSFLRSLQSIKHTSAIYVGYTESEITDVNGALLEQAGCCCCNSSSVPTLCVPSCTAILATAQCGDPRHKTWLLPLLLHLRVPIRLSLCSVALDSGSIPAHKVAADWEENGIDGNPSEQDAKVAAYMRLFEIEERRACELDDCKVVSSWICKKSENLLLCIGHA